MTKNLNNEYLANSVNESFSTGPQTQISTHKSVLEIPFENCPNIQIDLIQISSNKFTFPNKEDYDQIIKASKDWLKKNNKKSNEQYQWLIDELKNNFYEGFNDSMSIVQLKSFDRESKIEDSLNDSKI